MLEQNIIIRNALESEFKPIGQLVAKVYAELDGFPSMEADPTYYNSLLNIGNFVSRPQTELFAAVQNEKEVIGAVLYFGNLEHYGSGGITTSIENAAGIRLLAVHPESRGLGLGKILTQHCIDQAKKTNLGEVILHSTAAMKTAWGMYERMGFKRSKELDFLQEAMTVYGFRLKL